MGLSGHADPKAVLGVIITFTILACIAIILRLYTRVVLVRSAGWDDVFIVVAGVMTIGQTVSQCFQVKYGMGRHILDLTPYEQLTSLKPFYSSIIIYNCCLFSTKFSILLQYLRIFPHKMFRILCYSLMGFVCVWSTWTILSAIFFCTPVSKFWEPAQDGWCFSEWGIWFSNAGVNIITDICVATLPLPFLHQLQLPKRQRYALMTVFALGGFTCIISILRLESLLVFLNTKDISWNNPLAATWSSVEVNTGILCSCLPTLKNLLARVWPKALGGSHFGHSAAGPRQRAYDRSYDSGYSARKPKASHDENAFGFGANGRGYSGRDFPLQRAYVHSGATGGKRVSPVGESVEDMDFGGRGKNTDMEDGIQVVTVVEQEFERGSLRGGRGGHGGLGHQRGVADRRSEVPDDGKSESGSTRELVPGARSYFHG